MPQTIDKGFEAGEKEAHTSTMAFFIPVRVTSLLMLLLRGSVAWLMQARRSSGGLNAYFIAGPPHLAKSPSNPSAARISHRFILILEEGQRPYTTSFRGSSILSLRRTASAKCHDKVGADLENADKAPSRVRTAWR